MGSVVRVRGGGGKDRRGDALLCGDAVAGVAEHDGVVARTVGLLGADCRKDREQLCGKMGT